MEGGGVISATYGDIKKYKVGEGVGEIASINRARLVWEAVAG